MLPRHYLLHATLKREHIPTIEHYPFHLPAVRTLETLAFHPKVTYFIGENGSGKSTLLEALAVALGFNPEGGSKNLRFGTRDSHSPLHQYLRLARGPGRPRDGFFLRAESFFNVASEIETLDSASPPSEANPPLINAYGGRSLHEQSHGESFLQLLTHRFGGHGLYLLDEPEAALSPQRQLAVLRRIHQLVGTSSQLIIATHSPILLAYPDAQIYHFGPEGLAPIAYEETEHYQVTRNFLTRREPMLRELLED